MRSPAEMSKMIRMKKKQMMEDRDVIDSGGSPSMDLQDEEIMRLQEATDEMDKNQPKERTEDQDEDPMMEREEQTEAQVGNANPRQDEMSDKELAGLDIPMHMAEGGEASEEELERSVRRKERVAKILGR